MWKRLVILIAFLSLTSCVYYNTFYNARQKFKKAEKNQAASSRHNRSQEADDLSPDRAGPPAEPSISLNDKSLYKEAIEKANKVVLYHPDSKYIDDALWLIGKARYNMTEFVTADKKLRELIVRDPKSKYVDDAYYYIGMSQFWLNNYDLALEAFSSLLSLKKSPYKDDASFNIAYMDYLKGNFNSSIESFKKLLSEYSNSDSSASAQFFIAVCYDSLGDKKSALGAYQAIDKFNPSHDLYFDAQYAFGSSALEADSISLGMSIFEKLAKKERYFNKSSIIRLKLAEGMRLSGKIEDAVEEYLKVAEQFPKTDQSSEAFYRLGLIYQNELFDLEKAKDYFNKATQEKRDSKFRNLALAKSAQISKLETYKSRLGLEKDLKDDSDTTVADPAAIADKSDAPDSANMSTPNENTAIDSAGAADMENLGPAFQAMMERAESRKSADTLIDQEVMLDSSMVATDNLRDNANALPENMAEEDAAGDSVPADTSSLDDDIEVRFLLAELYHHDLNRPDSALNEYLLLAETYPESEFAPKALLASAFIYENKGDTLKARSIYEKIIDLYPSSSQARFAVTKVEASIPDQYDILNLYRQAEEHYFVHNDPQSALAIFEHISKAFPQSEYAAKSAYAKAWILSKTQQQEGDSMSYLAFADIVENYPGTPYAEGAKVEMGLVKKDRGEDKKPQRPESQQQQEPDDGSKQPELADSLFNSLPPAPPVLDSVAFVYPESLMNARREERGKVIFKIRLDLFGNIIDYEMLGPSGSDLIDSVAVQTLRQTTFDMSKLDDLTLLDGYFRYDIKFEPPRDWEDRYKHSDPFDPYDDQRGGGP